MILHAQKHMGQMVGVSAGMFVELYKLGEMLKVRFETLLPTLVIRHLSSGLELVDAVFLHLK
jgi:hypothetical protein